MLLFFFLRKSHFLAIFGPLILACGILIGDATTNRKSKEGRPGINSLNLCWIKDKEGGVHNEWVFDPWKWCLFHGWMIIIGLFSAYVLIFAIIKLKVSFYKICCPCRSM